MIDLSHKTMIVIGYLIFDTKTHRTKKNLKVF